MVNLWSTTEHVLGYLAKADSIPHRTEGEAVLLDYIPKTANRILDLGTGDGRLMALLKIDRPQAAGQLSGALRAPVLGTEPRHVECRLRCRDPSKGLD